MEHTETLIVEQLKLGDENAWQYIYDHHYALLCHIANHFPHLGDSRDFRNLDFYPQLSVF